MNIADMVFGTIGGLALFMFGMDFLSRGLKLAAGDSLRRILDKVTRWRVMALLLGAGVTCLIQSSSAMTVMVVGLVNAGLLTLKQAICVVLGANIGTSSTAWLVAGMSVFKITHYALPAVALGFALHVFGRRQRTRHFGQILLGFGILFIGIGFMKEAFGPLQGSEGVQNVLVYIGDRPVFAVLAGTVLTMLVQSSSASIAMIQVLAFSGAFGTDPPTALRVAIPFVLGDNIGTTITAQIAALRTNLSGRRTAMAHTLFNVIGVAIMLPLIYRGWFMDIVCFVAPWPLVLKNVPLFIAVAHTSFNVIAAFVMLPAVGLLEAIVVRILPATGRAGEVRPVTLEQHLLDTPPMAMAQARREIVRMAKTAKSALDDAIAGLCDDRRRLGNVRKTEDVVDDFQTQITGYLVALSQRTLNEEMARELPVLLHTVNDLERVSDHAVNIAETAERKFEQKHIFSEEAVAEIARMRMEVSQMFEDVLVAITDCNVDLAGRALEHEKIINQMQVDCRNSHVRRLADGKCGALAGLLFVDYVDNMEKIGDHLTNVAQGVIAGLHWIEPDDQQRQHPELAV